MDDDNEYSSVEVDNNTEKHWFYFSESSSEIPAQTFLSRFHQVSKNQTSTLSDELWFCQSFTHLFALLSHSREN